MKSSRFVASIFLLIVFLYPLSTHLREERYQKQTEIPAGFVIPSQYSRVLSLGNYGMLSDWLFLKAVTFFGGRNLAEQQLKDEDWQYLAMSMDVITDLDPYFLDPYFLSEGLLAWDAGMPEKANIILQKGIKYRPKDWRLPFFVGFNHFYFLSEYDIAADYIMQAARLPGSPDYLKTLAARLAFYGGKSKTALLFLKQMVAEANDPLLSKRLTKRLVALERAVKIEEAMDRFKNEQGTVPATLNLLVEHGYLEKLPEDPYGGEWGVLQNGRVFSTSKFSDMSKQATE